MMRNYEIQHRIGEGGMGVVYRATDIVLERTVAVKILHNHLVKDPVFYERFRNEAILLARLNHPNVTTLYNFSTDEEQSFMVMEYVEGITLEQLLKKEKVISVEAAIPLLTAASRGLQHAHEKGIFHRDIKSSNIMISEKGEVKLMDFGIAKMKGSTSLTRIGSIIGTLEYMAPELLNGSPPSVVSDLYSMGVVMYELLTGKLPFEENTEASLINSIIHQKPLPLRTYTLGIPKELEVILASLLRKNPEKRIRSAEELRFLLEKVRVSSPVRADGSGRKKAMASARKIFYTLLQKGRILSIHAQEGYILIGSLFIAALIVIFGVPSLPSRKVAALQVPDDSVEVETLSTVPRETLSATVSSGVVQPVVLPKPDSVKKKTFIPKKEEHETSLDQKAKQELKQPETGEKVHEVTYMPPEEKKVISEQSILLENVHVSLVLDETLSSDDREARGKDISFKVTQDVYAGGIKVISAGAAGTGRVLKTRSSGSGRSFLEIRPESVRAVNGKVLKLKSLPLGRSGNSTEPVIFSKGIRISPDPQIITTTIKL